MEQLYVLKPHVKRQGTFHLSDTGLSTVAHHLWILVYQYYLISILFWRCTKYYTNLSWPIHQVIPGQTGWDPDASDQVAGIFKDDSGSTEIIVPWVGTDPDSNIQHYTSDQNNAKWGFPTNSFDRSKLKIKAANHPGQFRP